MSAVAIQINFLTTFDMRESWQHGVARQSRDSVKNRNTSRYSFPQGQSSHVHANPSGSHPNSRTNDLFTLHSIIYISYERHYPYSSSPSAYSS